MVFSFSFSLTVPGAPPRNISHEVLSSSEVKLSWEPPPLDQQNGIITGYLVYVLTVNRQTLGIHSSYNRTFTVTSLKEHTSYKFEIAARTQIGVGPFYMYIETVTTLHGKNTGSIISLTTHLQIKQVRLDLFTQLLHGHYNSILYYHDLRPTLTISPFPPLGS